MKFIYILVDPVNHAFSGITKYTQEASFFLETMGVRHRIIQKGFKEKINEFRLRLSVECEELLSLGYNLIVEAPETYASTLKLDERIKVHIRLHFSKAQGAFLEGKSVDKCELKLEQEVIKKAAYVSAPSKIAAVYAKFYFDLNLVHVFPNPFKVSVPDFCSDRKWDVGFIGRWQKLKGIDYVAAMIQEGKSNFLLQSNFVPKKIRQQVNVSIVNGREKNGVYKNTKVVIVPSLFETSSMVIAEALLSGAQVVTWSHMGICEYLDHPNLHKINPFDYNEFSGKAHSLLSLSAHTKTDRLVSDFYNINELYCQGLQCLLDGKSGIEINNQNCKFEYISVNKMLKLEGSKDMANSTLTPFERKLRKLKRSPLLFFKDMLKKKLGKVDVPPNRTSQKNNENDNAFVQGKRKKRRANILFNVNSKDKIKFHDYGEKNNYMRTCAIFKKQAYESYFYRDMLEKVFEISSDFWPLRRENLGRGYISEEVLTQNSTSFDWHASTTHQEFSKVKNIKVLLIFDIFNISFLSFLRSISHETKIVLVSTESGVSVSESIYEYVDSVISYENMIGNYPRKKIEYESKEDLPIWLRKIVQEYLPKDYNYFLPVCNGFCYSDSLLKEIGKGYSVIIKLSGHDFDFVYNADAYITQLVNKVESMYVDESTYLNYKSLLDDVDSESLYHFLKYSLKDGVVIDVR